jgi:hypothetical protein
VPTVASQITVTPASWATLEQVKKGAGKTEKAKEPKEAAKKGTS